MVVKKRFIVDEGGNIKSVILDYEAFKKIEELLLDFGLAKAMEEVADEEEIDIEEAERILGLKTDGT